MRWLLGAALSLAVVGCEHSGAYWRRGDNFVSRCGLVVDQVRGPLDKAGARFIQFLPFGSSETPEGTVIDFYAPMVSEPTDQLAHDFYGSPKRPGMGQVTHYLAAAEIGVFMANCLSRAGLRQVSRNQQPAPGDFPSEFSAVFEDRRLARTVAIMAKNQTIGLLVAGAKHDPESLTTLAGRMQ